MPSIRFMPMDITVKSETGASILETALANDIDLEHACGGFCACTTCHVVVQEGVESLGEMDFDEEDKLDEVEGVTLRSRLGCQARLGSADIVVTVPPKPY
jgi:ferredoxin, 2Fe-2S